MPIPDEVRLGIEILGVLGTGGTILFKLGRLGERFKGHETKLEQVEDNVDKIKDALTVVAVQKEAIQSIRDSVAANTKRTDESFNRVFTVLDRLQER